MIDLEKLGAFYLGKEYDLESGEVLDSPIMYDARDLTTHAVCVGMTGSGKTGLCIDLLEEAALDLVPSIIIDPKGDMTNLLLTFPELRPEDFLPWVNIDDARRKDLSVEEYAEKIADTWRKGLEEWGEGPERIQRLKDAADFTVYTPGSSAGVPVNILSSFSAPELDWEENEEALRERVQGTVSALLGMAGVEADPVKSREHIFLSNIIEHAWREGTDMDLAEIIRSVQSPPIRKLGVFDVDTFFPEKDRFELAMALNNLIAAPGFERWLEGQPLDVTEFLATSSGKPKVSIFYIAHLNDAERMFFVTLLLEQILTWMRAQSGTTSLRGLLYFDEVFGYFPPVAEPPSKRPLLTLLKQARAFGFGVMLTTQNPVDLDYKGLTNAGTWFIGKLQTERDKMRVLEGLESVVSEAGTLLDKNVLDKLISSLDSRVFLLHNVHEDGPVIMNTRWAMSYLRGPLTRKQVGGLMKERKALEAGAGGATGAGTAAAGGTGASAGTAAGVGAITQGASRTKKTRVEEDGLTLGPPALPPTLETVILPASITIDEAARAIAERGGAAPEVIDSRLVYRPMAVGLANVQFVSKKYGVSDETDVVLAIDPPDTLAPPDWDEAELLGVSYGDLNSQPPHDALFEEVPVSLNKATKLKKLSMDFADHLYRSQSVTLFLSPATGIHSKPGEAQRDFVVRCREAARELRDDEIDKLSDKYDKKIDLLRGRIAKKERDVLEDEADYEARKREEMLSAGESVLGVFLGRRSSRALSTAARKRRMTTKAKSDIAETRALVGELREDLAELQEEAREEAGKIATHWEEALDEVEEVKVSPRRTDIDVGLFALGWAPHWRITFKSGDRERRSMIPAYESK